MAKPPTKRRGIALGARADSAEALDLLSPSPTVSDAPRRDETRSPGETPDNDLGASPETPPQPRTEADPDLGWMREAGLLQGQLARQLRQLEEQREQIAAQARQLCALDRGRRGSGRLGVLVALLALSATAALGFHAWPELQGLAGKVRRLSSDLGPLASQVQRVHGQLASLTSGLGQTEGDLASLRQDVSGVRSELGTLRQTVAAAPVGAGLTQADPGGRPGGAHAARQQTADTGNPYRAMRPARPW